MRVVTAWLFVSISAALLSAQTGGGTAAAAGGIVPSPLFVPNAVPGGVVTGMPYSAEQVTERVQTLADGTHIKEPAQTTRLYRDSQGRTRTERSSPLPPGLLGKGVEAPVFIDISDPVAGVRYSLESQSHQAHKMPMTVAPRPPAPQSTSTGATVPRMIQLVPAQRAAQPVTALQDQSSRPQVSRESLGTQMIEGVPAEGTRTTTTYPIGAVGNDRPITATTETWTSPELKMVVLSKSSDPRTGDSTTRLFNISRAEPDASLFQVPPDYEIVEPQ